MEAQLLLHHWYLKAGKVQPLQANSNLVAKNLVSCPEFFIKQKSKHIYIKDDSTLKPGLDPNEAMTSLKRHHSMSSIYKKSAQAANFVLQNHGVSAPKHQEMPKLSTTNAQFYLEQ